MNITSLMKRWTLSRMVLVLIGCLLLGGISRAAVSIQNFQLTENSLVFDISGTLPGVSPGSSQNALFFSNPTIMENPGFALGEFITTQVVSFSGSQFVERVATGGIDYGDYFYVYFAQDSSGVGRTLLPGEMLSGRLVATWSETAFNPLATSQLNVYWGTDWAAGYANSGVFLTTVQVPEPSVLSFFGFCLFLRVCRRQCLTMRCSEPGVSVAVAILASRGPGR